MLIFKKPFIQLSLRRWCVILASSALWLCAPYAQAHHTRAHAGAQTSAPVQTTAPQKLQLSHLYIILSDAMEAQKRGDAQSATLQLAQLQIEFAKIPQRTSTLGQTAEQAIKTATAQPSTEHISALSNALLAFEQEQNPVDYSVKQAEFKRKINPALTVLSHAIDQAQPQDSETLKQSYRQFNQVWVSNERVVRNTSMAHYGAIETAMALMRVAIESTPMDVVKIKTQRDKLQAALNAYHQGDAIVSIAATVDYNGGVQLLRDAQTAMSAGNTTLAQDKLTSFIEQWPNIEGEVRTRDAQLYSRVESQIPVILARAHEPAQLANLQSITNALSAVNHNAQYGVMDATLILLREGVEAMLIVLALVGALNAARQPQGKKWIYAGVVVGVVASVLGALVLQQLFPAVSAGANREILEGMVGIAAVLMMLMVGAWLHSKSSLTAWTTYIQKHMGRALSAGSLLSLFALSFLAVFREGAETIIFFAGILPKISTGDFVTGIVIALVLLGILAWAMVRFSLKIPFARLFKILTWLIYALGFKMLGISVHALQLTGVLPTTVLASEGMNYPALGIFPTVETLGAQALYVLVILLVQYSVYRGVKKSAVPSVAIE